VVPTPSRSALSKRCATRIPFLRIKKGKCKKKCENEDKVADMLNNGYECGMCTLEAISGNDICAGDCDKPLKIDMVYTGENVIENLQGSKSAVSSNPNTAQTVNIIAGNDGSGAGDIYFQGPVSIGERLTIDGTSAGRLNSATFVLIQDLEGNLLQTVEFNTSCSVSINLGDRFGALDLMGYLDSASCGSQARRVLHGKKDAKNKRTITGSSQCPEEALCKKKFSFFVIDKDGKCKVKCEEEKKGSELLEKGYECGTCTQEVTSGNDVCSGECDKPLQMHMRYTGDNAVQNTQGSKSVVSGDPNGEPVVEIIASKCENGTDDIYFQGPVNVGEMFTIDGSSAGKLNSATHVTIKDLDGNVVLQSVEFHTSCSVPDLEH
jgi:hypothetical protein